MDLRSLFKQSSIYLAGDMARRTVGFLMIPVYTRYLSPADYGVIELIELFVAVTTITFGILATSDAMVRIYHDYASREENSAAVVSTTLWYMTIAGVTVAGLAWNWAAPMSRLLLQSADYSDLIRYAFVAMVFSNLTEVGLVYERMRLRATFFVAFSLLQVSANLALNVYFIVFAGLGVWGFVLSKLITSAAGSVFLLARLAREVGWKFDRAAGRAIFQFGFPLIFSSAALFVIHFADRFFLSRYSTLAEVGVYALAYKFGFLVTYLVGEPFGRVWSVNLYSYVTRPDWSEQFGRVATYLVFFLLLAATALSVFIPEALKLVATPAFYAGAQLVPIIAFAYAFRELGDFFRGVLFIGKRARLYSGITIACALLKCGTSVVLVPSYGAKGAAWATALTWGGYLAFCWVTAGRQYRLPYEVKSFAVILLTAGTIYWVAGAVRPEGLWAWCSDAAWVGVFGLFVWAAGYFPPVERKRIRAYISLQRLAFSSMRAR
jgi:O-antigen/teichoic acid export membrane protein